MGCTLANEPRNSISGSSSMQGFSSLGHSSGARLRELQSLRPQAISSPGLVVLSPCIKLITLIMTEDRVLFLLQSDRPTHRQDHCVNKLANLAVNCQNICVQTALSVYRIF